MAWNGDISLDDNHIIKDVHIHTDHAEPSVIPSDASLRFLSIVETSRVPLYLSIGSPCAVSTANSDTQSWFSHILLLDVTGSNTSTEPTWWQNARVDSPLGALASVESPEINSSKLNPRPTEVLFYACHRTDSSHGPPTPPSSSPPSQRQGGQSKDYPTLELKALVLSSDLIASFGPAELTPPSTPEADSAEAVFLPTSLPSEKEIINEPPVRKRKTANDAFDEAKERRRKARRKGGEGVAAAAAPRQDKSMPSLQHRRSASNNQIIPLQTRPLSRSPSIASSRPPTANRPSALSKVESAATVDGDSTIEQKNKDVISRIVMTGMRLYGLVQSKKRKFRTSSAAPSPAVGDSLEDIEAERKSDEEYKLIYHQVFKGTCLTFRASIASENLQPFSAQIRDVVDQLLVIFSTDPLANGLGLGDNRLTPGGRKAFATGSEEQHNSPFQVANG